MKYEVKNYSHLQNIGEISNEAFALHLKLYEGYVKNSNLLLDKFELLKKLDAEAFTQNAPEFAELHRRLGWEFNGMRLHEIFFDSITTNFVPLDPTSGKVFEKDFGSFENWKKDFVNICKMRGMGWTMLVQDKVTKRLINTWVNEHDAGMLADVNIILNFDMFEHAYIKDFGTDRQKYIDSLFAHIDWNVVLKRIA